MPIRFNEDEFADLVEQAMAGIPSQFRPYMENLSIEIQQRPTAHTLRTMHLDPDGLLLGVYHGVALTKRSFSAPVEWPDRIILFQRNIEAVCHSREDVIEQVRQTVLHEVGHHFGLSEDDLGDLGYG